jgi:transposase
MLSATNEERRSGVKTMETNGRMEGINRKIKTMLRQFYGLRDNDFLRLKLYALHESEHKLVG